MGRETRGLNVVAIEGIPGLHVELTRAGGGYRIAGQHLRNGGEYEYWLTIVPADIATFAEALGVDQGDIEGAWSAQVQQIVLEGESAWLSRRDVPYRFWSRSDAEWES